MKKLLKYLITTIITLSILLYSIPALAASAVISTSASSVKVGDTVTVTFKVKGANLAAVMGTFTYDSSILTYQSGSGGASNGKIAMVTDTEGGESSLSCKVKFKAKAAGKSSINLSITKTLNYDEESLGSCSAGAAITVKAAASPAPTPTKKPSPTKNNSSAAAAKPTSTPAPTPTPSPTPAVSEREIPVKIDDDTLYIWRSLDTITLPEGFSDVKVKYNGEEITAAANIDNNNFPLLLYVTDKDGKDSAYYLYDEKSGSLTPYKTISSKAQSYILTPANLENDIPKGYTEQVLSIGDTKLTAWQNDDNKDFYLLYLYDSAGESNFYIYDSLNGTIQRYFLPLHYESEETLPSAAPTASPSAKPTLSDDINPAENSFDSLFNKVAADNSLMLLVLGMLLIIFVLIIILLFLASKNRQNKLLSKNDTHTIPLNTYEISQNDDNYYSPKHSR